MVSQTSVGQAKRKANAEDSEKQCPRRKRHVATEKDWACPYYKFNPIIFWECASFACKRVSDVPLHISRSHTSELYCRTCTNIIDGFEEYQKHQLPSCDIQHVKLPYATEEQMVELKGRQKRPGDEATAWNLIWDIVFPKLYRPSNPHYDTRGFVGCLSEIIDRHAKSKKASRVSQNETPWPESQQSSPFTQETSPSSDDIYFHLYAAELVSYAESQLREPSDSDQADSPTPSLE